MLALSEHHRTFRYRVLLGALNVWRPDQDVRPFCPVDGCVGDQRDSLPHVLWYCGAAQRVWRMLLGVWYDVPPWATDPVADRTAIFSEVVTRIPARLVQRFAASHGQLSPEQRDALYDAWCTIVRVAMLTIWRNRCQAVHEGNSSVFQLMHSAWNAIEDTLRAQAEFLAARELVLHFLAARFAKDDDPAPDAQDDGRGPSSLHLLLHYDGGARGNPGPSGCGALLQHVQSTGSQLVWTSATFLGTGTNNTAEYSGVLAGVFEAERRGATKLTIVGDSALVRSHSCATRGVARASSISTAELCYTSTASQCSRYDMFVAGGTRRRTP